MGTSPKYPCISLSPCSLTLTPSSGIPNECSINKSTEIISINSKLTVNIDCLNFYEFSLPKTFKLINIDLIEFKIPKQNNFNVTNKNNILIIEQNKIKHEITIIEGYYNRNDLIKQMNTLLPLNIECLLENDHFIIKSDNIFMILNDENTILNNLGFIKNAYVKKNIYISENTINIGDNIFYINIDNISKKPLFFIDNDNNIITKLHNEIDNDEIDYLNINFCDYDGITIKNNIINSYFFDDFHELKLLLNY